MSRKEKSYSVELKYQAVSDYLSGKGSLREICRKYKIRSTRQLRNWIKMYNGHKELKCYTGGSRMTKGRKTTYGHTFTSREQLISTIESYIDYYNNRRYQHRLFIQTPMQAHVSAMNRAAWPTNCTKKFAVPLSKRRMKSYIILTVYLTECTSFLREAERPHFVYFFRYSRGVMPKCALNARLK